MSKGHHKHDHHADDHAAGVGERLSDAATATGAAATDAAQGALAGLQANPLLAVAGGLALGAIAGALIPRSDKERDLLAPIGSRLGEATRAAIAAGRETGAQSLDEAGLSVDNLRQQAAKLIEQSVKAASSAGGAAFNAARDAGTA